MRAVNVVGRDAFVIVGIERRRDDRDRDDDEHDQRRDGGQQNLHDAHGASYSSPESKVAMPRNDMNPATSVTVVSTIVDDCAGSWPSRVSAIGMTAPATPAMTMDSTMAIQITSARPEFPLQSSTPMPVVSRDGEPVDDADAHLLEQHAEPVARRDLAQREPAHRDRERLGARVTGLPRDDRQQHGQRRELRDRRLEQPDDGRREKRRREIDLQPRQPLADRELRLRQRALLAAGAHHHLDVDRRGFLEGLQQRFVANDADQAAVDVDDGQHVELEVAQLLRDFVAIVERRHGRARRAADLLQHVRRLGDHEVVDVDDAGEAPFRVDDEELAQILRLALPQLLERDGGGLLAAEARDARIHDAARPSPPGSP